MTPVHQRSENPTPFLSAADRKLALGLAQHMVDARPGVYNEGLVLVARMALALSAEHEDCVWEKRSAAR